MAVIGYIRVSSTKQTRTSIFAYFTKFETLSAKLFRKWCRIRDIDK